MGNVNHVNGVIMSMANHVNGIMALMRQWPYNMALQQHGLATWPYNIALYSSSQGNQYTDVAN